MIKDYEKFPLKKNNQILNMNVYGNILGNIHIIILLYYNI